ncbi:HNH endonuclease [Riemerella anatipestifer]|uniref:HNH endonuclease n=1 Tax=Riemerella anatipestifer TaxID=34085 RepID=A0AAP3AMG4_RIEAN|nr:DNA translocase FtsK [Riemerella anatipestifer]MCW0489601.1 HNH endonuclease [Riemerella anatipestifer]MCW0523204.1 HNH endonuclease [Riemerella anatipestifer]MDY3432475.1 DNA translocase FtsK [Riemerella anatipestifer]MDY3439220.1 DNA translocase FtsK [Riemerella anatipestifer]
MLIEQYNSLNRNEVKSDVNSSQGENEESGSHEREIKVTELTDGEIKFFNEYEFRDAKGEIKDREELDSIKIYNKDSLFDEAAIVVVETQQASASMLQRKLKISYNRAEKIILQLEKAKIVGKFEGYKARETLISNIDNLKIILKKIDDTSDIAHYGISNNYYSRIAKIKYNSAIKKGFNPSEQSYEEWCKEQEIRNKILKQKKEKDLYRKVKEKMIDEGAIPKTKINKREHISQKVKDMVWNRDGGKCVECGSSEKLEFDHIVPFSKGGSNTYRNIQLLCEPCNRKKSNKIG